MKFTNFPSLSQAGHKNRGRIAVSHLFHISLPFSLDKTHRYEKSLSLGNSVVSPFTIQAKPRSGGSHA